MLYTAVFFYREYPIKEIRVCVHYSYMYKGATNQHCNMHKKSKKIDFSKKSGKFNRFDF